MGFLSQDLIQPYLHVMHRWLQRAWNQLSGFHLKLCRSALNLLVYCLSFCNGSLLDNLHPVAFRLKLIFKLATKISIKLFLGNKIEKIWVEPNLGFI